MEIHIPKHMEKSPRVVTEREMGGGKGCSTLWWLTIWKSNREGREQGLFTETTEVGGCTWEVRPRREEPPHGPSPPLSADTAAYAEQNVHLGTSWTCLVVMPLPGKWFNLSGCVLLPVRWGYRTSTTENQQRSKTACLWSTYSNRSVNSSKKTSGILLFQPLLFQKTLRHQTELAASLPIPSSIRQTGPPALQC